MRAHVRVWRSGYWFVLALIVVSYVLCATQVSPNTSAIAFLVQLAAVALILWVAEVGARLRRIGWVVLSAAAVAVLVVRLIGTTGVALDIALSAASMVAYLVAPMAVLANLVRRNRIDGQALLAAIAAYILAGMFFTFVYNFIALVSPNPTFGAGQIDSLTSQLFFSFTTLTTTGYGNVVPTAWGVQSVAIAEAITGQLFLVIAVARVVSGWKHPAESRETRDKSGA